MILIMLIILQKGLNSKKYNDKFPSFFMAEGSKMMIFYIDVSLKQHDEN